MRAVVVDDEPKIRKGLSGLIERAKGWEVAGSFDDAKEALEFLRRHEIELTVTDIRMPQVSGLDLIYQIREVNQRMDIVIVSGYSDFSYAQRAIELGVKRYLTKPTNPVEVFRLLEEIRSRRELGERKGETEPANQLTERVQRYIEENYSHKLGLKEIAEKMYISPNYLCNLFKCNTGCTVTEYISEYRIARAKELLQDVRYRINDVAKLVGFSDSQYFSSTFKHSTGMTPTEYRNRRCKK